MDIQDRLKSYLDYKELTYKQFESICGLGNGTAARISDKTRETLLNRISIGCPDLNTSWLMTGEGDMLRPIVTQHVGDIDGDAQNVNVYNSDAAYTTLLKIVESHQATTDSLIDLFKSQQAQSNKQMEQTDKLISLLQAIIERAK